MLLLCLTPNSLSAALTPLTIDPINAMEGPGSGHRPFGVMSGKGYSSNSSYTERPSSPGGVPVPGSVNRGSQSAPKPWGFKDPEAKRKKRIAKYKVYAIEGKVKTSLTKGIRLIKNKCSWIVNGY